MTEKERLIELLADAGLCHYDTIADHLLANGVIVPPCKVGDMVYVIEPCTCYSKYYANSCKEHFENDKRIKALLIVPRGKKSYRGYASCFKLFERKFQLKHLDKIGKTVFLTQAEAEKALAERGQQ